MNAAQHQLESEIASTREEIVRLKQRLSGSFQRPSEFVAVGDALRLATDTLGRLEVKLKMMKLESREEVWWRASAAKDAKGAVALPRSEQFRAR